MNHNGKGLYPTSLISEDAAIYNLILIATLLNVHEAQGTELSRCLIDHYGVKLYP